MVELVVAVVGLISACIFLAHAIEAYRRSAIQTFCWARVT